MHDRKLGAKLMARAEQITTYFMKPYSQQVALVTGAYKGLGLETARQLAKQGLTVIIGARDLAKAEKGAETLCSENLKAEAVVLETTSAESVKTAQADLARRFGVVDVLVNNAGVLHDLPDSVLELDAAMFTETLVTNTFGSLLVAQAFAPGMEAQGFGRIVNVSSFLGSIAEAANPDSHYAGILAPGYRVSKAALNMITVLLAKELRGSGVLVNSVDPGWVKTDMGGDAAPLNVEQGADTIAWAATLPDDAPTAAFFSERKVCPW